ncbi:MAG: SDR family oxidoreductase [Formivibrio sp.]|nr:SDR family oxidoreductase [Formivibrio sp.]
MMTDSQRLVLVGAGSFIARHVYDKAIAEGLAVIGVSHDADLGAVILPDDIVVNFGVTPSYMTAAYTEENDFDLRVARCAHAAKARFVAISTRKVYSAEHRWSATEPTGGTGDGSFYGANKAISERAIAELIGPKLLILRLSNIFGFEFRYAPQRCTFLSRMLSDLREKNSIFFDMAPQSQRDFLPVERCASMIIAAISRGLSGIYNVGCGFPIACGSVAQWVMEGFGGGRLVVSNHEIRDEFFLDMTKWRESGLPLNISPDELHSYCIALGRILRLA